MFILSTDNITVFAFKGSVDENIDNCFIVNKRYGIGLRLSYTKDSSSTDSLRGIHILHSVTFNGVGNADPLYATVYGINEEDLPVYTCATGCISNLLWR